MESYIFLCGIAALIPVFYYFLTSTFDFWKSRGVCGPRPILGFGNFKDVIFSNISAGEYLMKIYKAYKEKPLVGIFNRTTPILIVKDLDLIKDVLIKDFSVFADRGFLIYKKVRILQTIIQTYMKNI